jgi:hypothetical protein
MFNPIKIVLTSGRWKLLNDFVMNLDVSHPSSAFADLRLIAVIKQHPARMVVFCRVVY